ncbi:hypothetical protein ACFS2C_13760 [Prauserella oleivorans]|uniref:Uncharacterized protein n=1 Tax=Prauserella oleivorans TaxID=1478153 RepID=A0ABW5WBS0_9PSEU
MLDDQSRRAASVFRPGACFQELHLELRDSAVLGSTVGLGADIPCKVGKTARHLRSQMAGDHRERGNWRADHAVVHDGE